MILCPDAGRKAPPPVSHTITRVDKQHSKEYCVAIVFWILFYVFASPHVCLSGEMKLKIIAKLQANISVLSHIEGRRG